MNCKKRLKKTKTKCVFLLFLLSFFYETAVGRSDPSNCPGGTVIFHCEKAKMAVRSISHWHSLQLPSTDSVARTRHPTTTSNLVSNELSFLLFHLCTCDRKRQTEKILYVDYYLTSNYAPQSPKFFLHIAVNPLSWRDHSDKYISRLRCPQVQRHGPMRQLCQ